MSLVLGALMGVAALSGCAAGGPGSPVGDSPTSPYAQSSPSEPAAATTPTTPDTGVTVLPTRSPEENPGDMTDPKPPGTERTLRGSVQAGVEANCILLAADDGKLYLLLGGDRQVINAGGRIEITGLVQPDLMTTCQQGTPVTVKTARRI